MNSRRPHYLRRCFTAGLIFWVPVVVTLFIINLIVRFLERGLNLMPADFQPGPYFGITFPGIGLLTIVLILLLTGMVASNIIGRYCVRLWDRLLSKIPLVRSIYHAVKSFLDNVLTHENTDAFSHVLLVQYPREDMWTIAFQTGAGFRQGEQAVGESLINIFVPTTPNPASGFMMTVPKADTKKLNMTVNEGLKLVLSLGAEVT